MRRATTVGRDALAAAGGEEGGELLGDDRAHAVDVGATGGAARARAASVSRAIRRTPGRCGHLGVDVARAGPGRRRRAAGRRCGGREIASTSISTPAAPVHETSTSTGPVDGGQVGERDRAWRRTARPGARPARGCGWRPRSTRHRRAHAVATVRLGHRAGADDDDVLAGEVADVLPPRASRAAETRLGATRSMSVSACERLPTRSACWNSTLSAGPTVPASWPSRSASRVWPRIWLSPSTIESSPAATWNRWETAPSS